MYKDEALTPEKLVAILNNWSDSNELTMGKEVKKEKETKSDK